MTADKQEYLDGWQRAKADLVNYKKQAAERNEKARSQAVEGLLMDLLPVLDSFDMATETDSWDEVDSNWREGVEHIKDELHKVLEVNGVLEIAPSEGDKFDPQLHEAVGTKESDDEDKEDTIVRMNRKGYKLGDKILRSAQVICTKQIKFYIN